MDQKLDIRWRRNQEKKIWRSKERKRKKWRWWWWKWKEELENDEDDESAEEGDGDPSGIANLEEDITNTWLSSQCSIKCEQQKGYSLTKIYKQLWTAASKGWAIKDCNKSKVSNKRVVAG